MNKKLVLAIALIFIVITVLAFFIFAKKQPENEITLFGNIEIRTVDLGFRVEGILKKMFFEEGDTVKKGDIVAELDDKNYRAAYEKSVAQVAQARAQSADAALKWQRNAPLCVDNTISKQDCDTLFNSKDSTAAALKSAMADLNEAEKNFHDAKILAPEEGIITTRVQEPGASVSPTQPVYVMAKIKPVWIRGYIPETQLGNLEYGAPAHVFTDTIDPGTGSKREYGGYVGYISPVAEFTPKTVQTTSIRTDLVYRVRVYVKDEEVDGFLRQGMPVTVKIDIKKDKDAADKQQNERN